MTKKNNINISQKNVDVHDYNIIKYIQKYNIIICNNDHIFIMDYYFHNEMFLFHNIFVNTEYICNNLS